MSYSSGSGGKVHADFLELQDFQKVLRQSIDQFAEIDSRTKSKLNDYEWKDNVATKFKNNFEEGMKPIISLTEKMEGFIPWLKKKENALIKYHGEH